jgi:hypothetical protein
LASFIDPTKAQFRLPQLGFQGLPATEFLGLPRRIEAIFMGRPWATFGFEGWNR